MWTLLLHHVHINKLYSPKTKLLSNDQFYSPTQHPNHPLAIYQVRPILCHNCRISYVFLGAARVLRVPGIQWKVYVHTQNQWFLHVSCFGTEQKLCQVLCRWTWPHSRPCPAFCHLQYLTASNEKLHEWGLEMNPSFVPRPKTNPVQSTFSISRKIHTGWNSGNKTSNKCYSPNLSGWSTQFHTHN